MTVAISIKIHKRQGQEVGFGPAVACRCPLQGSNRSKMVKMGRVGGTRVRAGGQGVECDWSKRVNYIWFRTHVAMVLHKRGLRFAF